MKKIYKIIMCLVIGITICNFISVTSLANYAINNVELYSKGDCGRLIERNDEQVRTNFIAYLKDGKECPAYTLEKSKIGVKKNKGYSVTVNSTIKNIKVWRTIINGYPYKTIEELGCENEKEAFLATKMAVYVALYDEYNIEQFKSYNEAGDRVINAINQIVTSSYDSKNIKISSDLKLTSDNNYLELDNINSKYVSKTFKVIANGEMQNYRVSLSGNIPEGAIISDENNNLKNEFSPNEKFKILLPIESLKQKDKMNLKVESKVKTVPIYFGASPDPLYQDYALTGDIYENGTGEIDILYDKYDNILTENIHKEKQNEIIENIKFKGKLPKTGM